MSSAPSISIGAAKRLLQIAAWIITLAVIAHGLQACATKRPASQSKFDQPKYDLDRRHKR